MKKKMNTVLRLLLIPVLLFSIFAGIPANANAETDLGLTVDAAILIDADSGKILFEQNADTSLGIASMTKMMTEYLLLDAIDAGTVKWDQEYHVTDYTYRMSQNRALSNVPLRRDGTYTIRELYEAMAIYSANAATVAIAETIAGSETEFLKLMNKKAEELGLEGYKFVNATGLNNADLFGMHPSGTGPEDENVMPAKSVAKLAYHLLKDHPKVLETSKIAKKTFREGTEDAIKMSNWNFMLPGLVYEYQGVDGLKTGTTNFAGHCFTGTAERNGTRLIAVVMKAVDANGQGSYEARFDATAKLFNYGFSQFSKQEILPGNYTFKDQKTVKVTKGKEDKVSIAVKEPISFMIKSSDKDLYKPTLVLDKKSLEADVKKGTVVGKVVIERTEGTDYGFIDGKDISSDVVTTEAVERASGISLFFQGVGNFFGNLWGGITDFVGGLF
ncbi:D-alanyl-D-alanine carboxypeptidase [Lysinibacillus sp. OL1_EC]|uniref:D-alanyl-D-alanine carboxypeptidase family protein n=1 Tax=unclassified Lysinibacillus TaxID=2636778 RepID=UPI00103ACBD6|nr:MULTISPECIES: D-alanyl-D-alanine carboxypeptidase family protein [unclassified Lysinibacillus]MCM0627329.1 D-alanyl-D-alanine carboxypeptidase [Lysinibacillus sp. OL1_EC]MCS5504014.1 D-alanyl-D-alanine carboxypeptidase [Lysinibacillus sp. A4]TBV84903.1 D-alanyl-D-alanine carboxypeptidase [Lysinibacillus sp. OL1]UKJ45503.1 D-alanyl-D-alanine carboxypeptidase [Lysinibacillus sp. ACHW1.5]WGT37633.1 D-alanyl-D-alanine carboxypeptidase family protein [Lysinibacillus sp. 1 U-2021]